MKEKIFAGVVLLAACASALAAEPTKTVNVNCGAGLTIAQALALGDERKPLVVVVSGQCNESVRIDRNDVTLRGEAGVVNGPDPDVNTIVVTANRVIIRDLQVTGGRNGITGLGAADLTVLNTTVQSTGHSGIVYNNGSSGVIDGCTVQLNARDGVVVQAATATIVNSSILQNSRLGVLVTTGGAARVGVDDRNNAAGNRINQNGATGLNISVGGQAVVAMNDISGNGTDATSTSGRTGITVIQGTADLPGGNTITGNPGQGIFARSASVQIGDPTFGFTTVNTITGNGNAADPGGVFGLLGSALFIRDAVIRGNNGFGLILSLRSHAQISSSTIQDSRTLGTSPGDGIRLAFGSGLFISAPNPVVSGNAGFGLQCTDGESSVINTVLLNFPPPANARGNISFTCTPF